MKTNLKKISLYYSDDKYIALANDIISEKLNIIKVLKDDQRSRVLLIDFNGEKLVVKEPKEKNRRKWQKFLSLFRGSASFLELKNTKKIEDLGFIGAKGHLVVETLTKGILIDKSYFVSSYIEGKEGDLSNLNNISDMLKTIHNKGLLHGDSQLVNFIVGKNKEIYLIDCKLSKNFYGAFGRVYEFIYLEDSCHRKINVFHKNNIYYFFAKSLKLYFHWLIRAKRVLRNK